ncbi:MAG: PAS domain S-box protein [Flavobacteriales bacterium]|nr:PAS domain S-box protein [Flavobacteriales bacterium]
MLIVDYSEVFKNSSEGLVICNSKAEIESVNPRMLEMFGYETDAELLGKKIEVLIPSKMKKPHVGMRNTYIKNPVSRSMGLGRSLSALRKDGSVFPVEVSLSHYGKVDPKIIAFISDISERIEIEEEVRRLNAKLEQEVEERTRELNTQNKLLLSIARNFPHGNIYVLNEEFKIVMADGTLLRSQGVKEGSLVGKDFIELLPEGFKLNKAGDIKSVFTGGTVEHDLESNGRHYTLLAVPLIEDDHAKITSILVVEFDVTVAKNAEKDMRIALGKEKQLNQLKTNFVTMVSHEFRTPLSTIFSSSQLIEKYVDEEGNDRRLRHTGKIQSSVSVLNNMVEDILNLSKLEEGLVMIKLENFNINVLTHQIMADLKSIYPNIRLSVNGGDVIVNSDRKLVKHILTNLIENGCKYGIDGGKVEVVISAAPQHLKIAVIDNGIGIPDSERKNLFDRFYRASNAQNIKGTGLGLNIVLKYLDLLGGELEFDSELNQGTTFNITLPKDEKNISN